MIHFDFRPLLCNLCYFLFNCIVPAKAHVLSAGEHTRSARARVLHSASPPTASGRPIGSKEDALMWSAGAPTTTREARVLLRLLPFHR